ncbi:UDP-N-acetylmuramate dehydrogenase [Clostridium pasteurianum]|uniref:UDP-N-acetylenolpyruvoylglucosamine reductase n=1 Tax=Clostridium pasteurianum BC1 TaxID=86416 RepID=R4KCU2_CLOPA|nr:UDP-N-acetylmuramate dehydrogenase [Clostridium pasteurianum]AGK98364.1 UDP-N-acetylenolpyruvoylglucosamine reductase [Clostridium pasteurianum BC1]
MKHLNDFLIKLRRIIDEKNIELNAKMKEHTSFKVGGPVDVLVTPIDYNEIINIIKLCKDYKVPFYIIGNGSNLLVKDGGIRGVVIKLTKLDKISVDGEKINAQGGATIAGTSRVARDESLTGLEFACGIPGSIGGALAMNAGAYDGEMSMVVESSLVLDGHGNFLHLNKEQLELEYRMSAILKNNYVVLEVTFQLKKGDYKKIKNRIDELMQRRREKQPLEYASAGSTFKRPTGHFAGKLIQDSGLKGKSVGDAEVSMKHSGFIINKGNAKARDILDLIEIVQNTVKEKFNVELHPEVRIIGEEEDEKSN